MNINHSLINWNLNQFNNIHNRAKTLILGSFNPNNPNPEENTDFYYGRNTNHFWKSIARNLNLDINFFTNNIENKLEYMDKYEFTFYDLINSIDFICNDEFSLNQYVNQNIFTNYSDNELFRVRAINHNGELIHKNLNFNYAILDLLQNKTLKKVIHTTGNNRITQNLIANPVNQNLGLAPFINQIIETSNENGILFVPISYSPSQIAVNLGGELYMNNLDNWIRENVLNI